MPTRIPLAAGQMEGHRWRLRELVDNQAVDILQPNVCFCGGYTAARKAAHLAQAFNLPIANGGGWPLLNLHTRSEEPTYALQSLIRNTYAVFCLHKTSKPSS